MNPVIIKLCSKPGQDPKIFRGYDEVQPGNKSPIPLGVSASTTGDIRFGVTRCAVKAFQKLYGGSATEIEAHLQIKSLPRGRWRVTRRDASEL